MNFYKHHIGDFAQATAHLSFVEDAAYSRMIRKYYAEEKPLPVETKNVQRLIGARTKEEKLAVEAVLEEFFILEADGWHNKRCDAELGKANAQADTNRRIAEEREAKKRLFLESKSLTNRANSVDDSFSESLNDQSTNRQPSQTPDTRHQTPDTKTEKQNLNPKAAHSTLNNHEPEPETAAPLGDASAEIKPKPVTQAPEPPSLAGAMAGELRRRGVSVTSQDPRLLAWIGKGVTVPMAIEAFEIARQRKPAPAPIPTGYLDVIIENEVLNPKPKKNLGPQWWSSEQATNAKAAELGMTAGGGESWESYRGRIRQRIAETERKSA